MAVQTMIGTRTTRCTIILGVVAASAFLGGCADMAKPDYEKCQQLKAAGKFDEALGACESAAKIASSKAATAAGEELPKLKAAIVDAADKDATDALKQWDAFVAKDASVVPRFEIACKTGSQLGCTALGLRYLDGIGGTDKDYEKALSLLRIACDANVGRACAALGSMHLAGLGVDKDARAAAKLLRQACDGGEQRGCEKLAALYADGAGGLPKDPKKGLELFEVACEKGRPFACMGAGYSYLNGLGTVVSRQKAFEFAKKSCDGGSGEGCWLLASLYSDGIGTPRDDTAAARAAKQSCELDEARGCGLLGAFMGVGKGVKRLRTGYGYLAKACNLDFGAACYQLGDWTRHGWGTEANSLVANDLFAKACRLGDASGCKVVGMQAPSSSL